MKKRISKIAPVIVTLFLCACSTEDMIHNENNLETPLPTATKAVEPTAAPTGQIAEDYINSLNRIDWTELEGYVNEENSIRNSNMLNYGYLTYDNNGKIYYRNENDKKIYVSGYKGENKQLIGENCTAGGGLQLNGDWLYYYDTEDDVARVQLESGQIEKFFGIHSCNFFIDGNKMYFENGVDKESGFCVMDLNRENKETILNSQGYLDAYTRGVGFWVGKIYGGSMEIWLKNYLVKFSDGKMELFNQRGNFPLLAGKYFTMISDETQTRHIYNLETKEEIDLKVDTEKAVVSDGTDFYYWSGWRLGSDYDWIENPTDMYCTISKWDGTSVEEIIKIDGASQLYHLFLTPEMLYYQPDFWVDEKQITQLWYYDLETGETGQIY